ncbi:tetratricopeptide repeat protein [Desulfobulbus sp. F5]|nr:tetratricopeptide repeat protein [Desulfobulbus sp. F5]
MDITGFEKIAQYLTHPLALIGFVLMLVFGMHKEIVKSGLLPQVSKKDGSEILKLILRYGFWLGLVLVLAGFLLQFSGIGLSAWNSYMEKEKVLAVDANKLARELVGPLQGQLEAKDQQIKALTEAITALSKTGAPAASINAALQALQQGDTAQAQAIFAEVLRSKEAEGKQANKEAAAAAMHLGALAFMNNPKEALIAYQKAVELDPDNAEGWNQLGHLFHRTGELAQAEDAYRKVLALVETSKDRAWQAIAYGNLGIVYKTRGDLAQAEEMHSKALALNEALGHKEYMAANYGNLGTVYGTRGELDKAEEMLRKALALDEALGRKEGIAADYGNLGLVYAQRGELDKAEEMYRKSLEISEALGLKEATANQYAGLGLVYAQRGELDKAEEMYRKALALNEALGSKEGMAINYGNLGNVAYTRGDLAQAEEMYKKALALDEALGSKEGLAANYANLGLVHEKRGDLAQAAELWKKSLSLYQEMKHPNAKMVQQWLDELAQQRSPSH